MGIYGAKSVVLKKTGVTIFKCDEQLRQPEDVVASAKARCKLLRTCWGSGAN